MEGMRQRNAIWQTCLQVAGHIRRLLCLHARTAQDSVNTRCKMPANQMHSICEYQGHSLHDTLPDLLPEKSQRRLGNVALRVGGERHECWHSRPRRHQATPAQQCPHQHLSEAPDLVVIEVKPHLDVRATITC